MGVTPSPPDPPIYKAFTISPSASSHTSKTTWATPVIKESAFPQSSLIAELSSLQEKDKSSIADKIARLSGEQRAAVYDVLVDLVGEEGENKGDGDGDAGTKLEWSVCEAVRVKDGKRGRTRYVRVFFVGAPVVVKDEGEAEGEKKELVVREGKGKEKEARSRSRGKDKVAEEVTVKEVPVEKEKSRRKPARERGKSKEKAKERERERAEEKRDRRRLTKSRHRKKEPDSDDSDECSCDELSDSTLSIRRRSMRRPKPRSLASRFKPAAYGRAEPPQWEKPVITPPRFPVRGYPQVVPPTDYHIRAAYEAGQRDAIAERMRNTALDRGLMPTGPAHVISFERLRPGFEDEFRSEGSSFQMYVGNSKERSRIILFRSADDSVGAKKPRITSTNADPL